MYKKNIIIYCLSLCFKCYCITFTLFSHINIFYGIDAKRFAMYYDGCMRCLKTKIFSYY